MGGVPPAHLAGHVPFEVAVLRHGYSHVNTPLTTSVKYGAAPRRIDSDRDELGQRLVFLLIPVIPGERELEVSGRALASSMIT